MQLLWNCKVQPLWKRQKLLRFKVLDVMKTSCVLLIATCFIFSSKAYSQKITLSLKNAPLEKAFKLIEQQTSYKFVYTDEAMALSKPVSAEVKNETLEHTLKLCFSNQPLSYSFEDNLIIVKLAEKKTKDKDITASYNLNGIVTNENARA